MFFSGGATLTVVLLGVAAGAFASVYFSFHIRLPTAFEEHPWLLLGLFYLILRFEFMWIRRTMWYEIAAVVYLAILIYFAVRQRRPYYIPSWAALCLLQSVTLAVCMGREAATGPLSVVTLAPSMIADTQPSTEYLLLGIDDNHIAVLTKTAHANCLDSSNMPVVYLARADIKVMFVRRKATVCAFLQGH
jgi:hypothetical protein